MELPYTGCIAFQDVCFEPDRVVIGRQKDEAYVRDVSVVIVSYNSRDWLVACLESLLQHQGNLDVEVIVVDNASSDGTDKMLRKRFPVVHLVANSENKGFSAANNQAFGIARGKYLLMLNPDTVAHHDAVQRMVDFLDVHPEASLVGPRIVDGKGIVDPSCHPFPSPWSVLAEFLGLPRLYPGITSLRYWRWAHSGAEPIPVDWVQGACLMFRRELVDRVGLLDTTYFLFSEEMDFCRRAAGLGYQTYYLPSAVITHHGSGSTRQVPAVKIMSHHRSKLYYFQKHAGWTAVLVLRIGFIIEMLFKIVLQASLWLIRPEEERARRLHAYFRVISLCLGFEEVG